MKKLLLLVLVLSLTTGCATKIVTPLPPTDSSLKSSYRKTVEVVIVDVHEVKSKRYKYDKEKVTVVESTLTGERFEVHGDWGKTGDRFKISY